MLCTDSPTTPEFTTAAVLVNDRNETPAKSDTCNADVATQAPALCNATAPTVHVGVGSKLKL